MVIEILGALSLPVWLCVEEVMRLRAQSASRAVEPGPSTVQPPAPARPVPVRSIA